MHILIDGLSARVGGGVTYLRYLLPSLVHEDNLNSYAIILSPQYQSDIIAGLPEGIELIPVDLPATPVIRRWWYLQTKLPELIRSKDFELFFAVAEGSYPRLSCPMVMLVRNSNLYAPLSSYARGRWKLLWYRLTREPPVLLSLIRASRLVFASETFRQYIVRHFHLPRHKTDVVYFGIDPIFFRTIDKVPDSSSGDNTKRYILSVSTINPHKNYEVLIRAFALIANEVPVQHYQLIIAGRAEDKLTYHRLINLVSQTHLEERVQFLGEVPHVQLARFYQSADLFAFPSRLETFGHPLVEAMASGCPILASDIPLCREICRDSALYVDPGDSTAWGNAILQLVSDPGLRRGLSMNGVRRAQDFSWQHTAQQMIEVFGKVG